VKLWLAACDAVGRLWVGTFVWKHDGEVLHPVACTWGSCPSRLALISPLHSCLKNRQSKLVIRHSNCCSELLCRSFPFWCWKWWGTYLLIRETQGTWHFVTLRFKVLAAVNLKMAVFWVAARWSMFALVMVTARISEMSVNFSQATLCNNPEDSHLAFERRTRGCWFLHKRLHSMPYDMWSEKFV
jgi:hypothetical protein